MLKALLLLGTVACGGLLLLQRRPTKTVYLSTLRLSFTDLNAYERCHHCGRLITQGMAKERTLHGKTRFFHPEHLDA